MTMTFVVLQSGGWSLLDDDDDDDVSPLPPITLPSRLLSNRLEWFRSIVANKQTRPRRQMSCHVGGNKNFRFFNRFLLPLLLFGQHFSLTILLILLYVQYFYVHHVLRRAISIPSSSPPLIISRVWGGRKKLFVYVEQNITDWMDGCCMFRANLRRRPTAFVFTSSLKTPMRWKIRSTKNYQKNNFIVENTKKWWHIRWNWWCDQWSPHFFPVPEWLRMPTTFSTWTLQHYHHLHLQHWTAAAGTSAPLNHTLKSTSRC